MTNKYKIKGISWLNVCIDLRRILCQEYNWGKFAIKNMIIHFLVYWICFKLSHKIYMNSIKFIIIKLYINNSLERMIRTIHLVRNILMYINNTDNLNNLFKILHL
jgi:hypothetical protein